MTSKISPHVIRYMAMVENGEINACIWQHKLVAHVRKCFDIEDIYTDDKLLDKCLGLVRYFPFERLFEWEEFVFALHKCTFRKSDGRPRWPDLLLLIGRGAGKDGYIAFDSFASISPHYGIGRYNIDICANNEDQAMQPLKDVLDVLETPEHRAKLKRFFYWNKEEVRGIKSGGVIKGRTNNAKGKDGLRSGQVTYNEVHQYLNWDNVNVFTTGLGKVQHPRRLYATTDGDVRDGPIDELKETAEAILNGERDDGGLLPFICRLDSRDEVHDPEMWQKANPSLPHRPDLMAEIAKEYEEWKRNPQTLSAFMTKRMNLPQSDADISVTDYPNIKRTNRKMPDLDGWDCVAGIDFVKVGDFASVDLHFRRDNDRFDINHSWLCTNSKDLPRIKAPWKDWARDDHLTVVDDIEIHPDLLCEYLYQMGQRYNILKLAVDNFRLALLAKSLGSIGFDANERKNIKLVRPQDIMKVVPVIDSCFNNDCFTWGDNPPLRWAVNNTKLVQSSKKIGSDTGNFYYAKIEARSRKTDPFMALVAAMTIEDELSGVGTFEIPKGMRMVTW